MARYEDKKKAISLRKKGYSYNKIKEELGVGKSTLSSWLKDYPLSKDRIKELTSKSSQRIEKYINTMNKKREDRFSDIFNVIKSDIGNISERELFVAGFFIYWAEGGKTNPNAATFTNTDFNLIQVYIKWLDLLKIEKRNIRVKLHLYKDMDINKEISFWSRKLQVKKDNFLKPYIKNSNISDISYISNFKHGTCNVILYDTKLISYILMGIKFIGNVVSVR